MDVGKFEMFKYFDYWKIYED